jgi:hypothetical protein
VHLSPECARIEPLVRPLESLEVGLLRLELGTLPIPGSQPIDQAWKHFASARSPREGAHSRSLELLPDRAVPRRGPVESGRDGAFDPGRVRMSRWTDRGRRSPRRPRGLTG